LEALVESRNFLDFKSRVRLLYFRSLLFRWLVNRAVPSPFDISHIKAMRGETALGPVQQDEALFLFSLIRVIRPKVLVEFGFNLGHSALNFLQAMPQSSVLYSYDIIDKSEYSARTSFKRFPNFHFLRKSQTDFSPGDVDNQLVDFVFIDASHEFQLNKQTWVAILPSLATNAIIAIHDTGSWLKSAFTPKHAAIAAKRPNDWLSDGEFQQEKGEREFVNWVAENYPEFQTIHLHTTSCLRHGITLLQRRQVLKTGRA
jgi:predicted O-methyltransferase YrrM